MGLNDTPMGERKHIAFFGCRNAGKSSLINAVTNQQLSIVSDVAGTTTDPVYKAMELLPAGPVVVIDTPGLDDVGELGEMRIKKTEEVIRKTDLAVLVVDASVGMNDKDKEILELIRNRNIPYIIALNKTDLLPGDGATAGANIANADNDNDNRISVSALQNQGIDALKERIAALINASETEKVLVGDLINPGDVVVLVVPIDKAAPKGRLILPQQQTIRDILDHGAIPVVTRDSELEQVIELLAGKITLVITDSQAFKKVAEIVPRDIPLTSFSILFSRYKGDLWKQLKAIDKLDELKPGARILIAEGCTHHRQCGDIGTEKIPAILKKRGDWDISFTSGQEFPADVSGYDYIIHCGGCMLNETEMKSRIEIAERCGVPMTNYGMFLAKTTGVLDRSMEPLREK